MDTVVIPRINGEAWRRMLVTTMSGRAIKRRGIVPTQYLARNRVRMSRGEERRSHIILPSSDIPGKTKRAAMAATTKPASPRFRKEATLIRKKETSSPVYMT
jgi:hypothetical protein